MELPLGVRLQRRTAGSRLGPITVAYDDCSSHIQAHLRRHFPNDAGPSNIFHPMQATTPMGFTWSVVLAHACMQRCNETAYAELLCGHPQLYIRLQFLRDSDARFHINPRRPLILLILDDQSTIACGWPDQLVLEFYQKPRRALATAGY